MNISTDTTTRPLVHRLLAWLLIIIMLGYAEPTLAESRRIMPMPEAAPGSVPIAGEYWALIIGIDKYTHAPRLETAVKDATGVRDALLTRYGFTRERIIELLDAQATRTRIENAFVRLIQQIGAEDSLLIYYAGHGQYSQDGQLGWWVPVEGQPHSPGTFITNASIREYIKGMKAKHVYLVADSCFAGSLFSTSRAMPPLNDQFFKRLYASRSRWGLTSGGTEPVADQGRDGHSIFAYHFIKLLQENTDPYLVPSHIYDQIAPLIANNSEQTPRSEPLKGAGDEGGQFVFRLAADGSESLFQRIRRFWTSGFGNRSTDSAELQEARNQLDDQNRRVEVVPVPPPSLAGQPREITGKDGVPMLMIPAGEFMMGSNDGDSDEKPMHRVSVNTFYLDKYEVTHAQFAHFVEASGTHGEWQATGANGQDQHPVVNVTWHDALAYCRWAEKRLPTEAEWEYAARGAEGRTYPWGNTWDAGRARIKGNNENDGTVPVGSFPDGASPFGILDLAGNVWEWTADWYDSTYYRNSPRNNPNGPSNGAYRVLRGGSWGSTAPKFVQSTNRLFDRPQSRNEVFGFRCAKDAR